MAAQDSILEQLTLLLRRADVSTAVVVGLLGFVFLLLISFTRKGKGDAVIVAGPMAAGKTTLFLQLRDSSHHNGTVTSMQENEAMVPVISSQGKKVTWKVVDIPGHSRLRNNLERSLRDCRAVVFVLDSVEYTAQKQETAGILYEVLAHNSVNRRKIPVLIACNKADLEDQAFSVDFIRKNLEKTLDAMRRTKAAALSDGSSATMLGHAGRPFTFQDLRSKVSFASISALTGSITEVKDFIASL